MVAPRVDGALPGAAQPNRVEFRGEIPKNGVSPVRRDKADRSGEATETVETTGWSATEEAYDRHEAGIRRKNRWGGFQGRQKGWAFTNADTAPFMAHARGPAPFQAPPKQLGEPALNYFMRFSAQLNEFYRAHGERVGVSQYGSSPADTPSALARRGRFRRRFALE